MSNNNGHLSRSEREILRLKHQIAELEESRAEYNLLLNILVTAGGGKYTVYAKHAKELGGVRPIRCVKRFATKEEIEAGEIAGVRMIFTIVEPEEPKRIITPS